MKKIAFFFILVCLLLSGCIGGGESSGVEWDLDVGGDVDSPFTISFDELLEATPQTVEATIVKTTGSTQTNQWTGVPIDHLMERAGLKNVVNKVTLEAFDGYSVTLDLDEVQGGLIAYEMDGERLSESEPLRMVLPEVWGPAWMRGLDRITFTTTQGKLDLMGEVKAPLLLSPEDLNEFNFSTVTFEENDYEGVALEGLMDKARYILDSTLVVYHGEYQDVEVPIENVIGNELAIVFYDGDSFGALVFLDEGSQVLEGLYQIEVK